MPSDTVIALRKQLREQFPAAHRWAQAHSDAPRSAEPRESASPFPLGSPHSRDFPSRVSDFPLSAITEVSPAGPARGLSLIVAALLAGGDDPLVLIDARDRFDPASFPEEECRRLLWLRCRETQQALQAADLLLRDGNLPFVLLDLSALPPRELRRIPNSAWHRLRQLAESTRCTLLVMTPSPMIPGAALRLELTRPFPLADLSRTRPELLARLQTQPTRQRQGRSA